MKSLSEIETTSKRASKAAGFSWGVAEEIGKNIRLLELFGFPGIKNLCHYFVFHCPLQILCSFHHMLFQMLDVDFLDLVHIR